MDVFIIGITAFLASLLTFFSGFGLGTILTPVFAIFFPAQIAVAQTSIVHFLNNIFKLILVGKYINKKIVISFGLPAIAGAFGGAFALLYLAQTEPLLTYFIGSKECTITPLKITVGILIIFFSILEVVPRFSKSGFGKDHLFIGGLLSGFFGGLSGHQGALRSAFLVRYDLSKEEYVSTGTAIACLIDITRISLYIKLFYELNIFQNGFHIISATICALFGALAGNYFLKKTTFKAVKILTHILLIIIALSIGSGLI